MRKDLKKLIKFLLITSAVLGTAYFIFIMWVAIKIVSPAGTSNLETEGSEVARLLDCKEMLKAENAWNPAVSYNYVYYLKEKHCPPPEELQNVEETQRIFCEKAIKEEPKLYRYFIRDKICPSDKSDNNSAQQNQDQLQRR